MSRVMGASVTIAGQFLTEVGVVFALGNFFAHCAFDRVDVGVDGVEGFVFVEQFGGRFRADAFDAGNVVAGIADECFVVYDLVGADTEFFNNGRLVIHFWGMAAAGGQFDAGIVIDELEQVAVAGDDVDGHVVGLGLLGDGTEYVVGFEVFQFEDGDVERRDDFADAFDLHAQFVGHFFAGAFVFLEEVVAEGAAEVKADGEVFRWVVGEDEFHEGAGEAVGGVGGFAFFGGECFQRQGEEHAVGQRVAVD